MALPNRLAPAAYLVAFALVAIPIFDASMTAFPPHLHDARWRFGAVGLISNAVLFPALGSLIAIGTAASLGHARTQRILGILAFLVALACLGGLGTFTLDALQTRAAVRPELHLSYAVASTTAGVKLVVAMLTFCALGIAGVRGPAWARPKQRAASVLVKGTA